MSIHIMPQDTICRGHHVKLRGINEHIAIVCVKKLLKIIELYTYDAIFGLPIDHYARLVIPMEYLWELVKIVS